MEPVGQKVIHTKFGIGVIVQQEGQFMTVAFRKEERMFLYPQGFARFFTAVNPEFSAYLAQLDTPESAKPPKAEPIPSAASEPAAEQTAAAPEPAPAGPPEAAGQTELPQDAASEPVTGAQPETAEAVKRAESPTRRIRRRKKAGEQCNVVFKLNYCDGGKNDTRVGFAGPCSQAQLEENVKTDKRPSCNKSGSLCRSCVNQNWSREEFLAQYQPCPESLTLSNWKVSAGVIQGGANKGKPLYLDGVMGGSLCILTTRLPQATEAQRCVAAVFLVDDSYVKTGPQDGYVTAKSSYKLALSCQEAARVLFWTYHKNENQPANALWGSGTYRYLSDLASAQLLRDIAAVKQGSADEMLAGELLNAFCQSHSLDPNNLGKPEGALTLL